MISKSTIITTVCVLMSVLIYAQAPVANFQSDIQSGCSPIVVNFQDLSTGNPGSWTWDFGNGATSTKQNPSTSYFTPGTYTVTLTVANANGSNTVTKQTYITVYENPKPEFISDTQTGCFPKHIQFKDQSTPVNGYNNVSWHWDFGNGLQATDQNPVGIYRSAGQFSVFLKVTNDKGCSKTISKQNYINITPGVTIGFSNPQPAICNAPYNITFNNTTSGPGTLNYSWNFGDGDSSIAQSPTHPYKTDGSYTVTLVATSSMGCSDTLIRNNAVTIPKTKTTFVVPDTICINKQAAFYNTSTPDPQSSLWQFSDGTTSNQIDATKTFTTPGTYTIKLTNTFASCTGDTTKTVIIVDKPTLAFTAPVKTACKPPLTVQFNNNSQNGATYFWDFGDGNTSTAANPTHTYTQPGEFNVKLIAYNKNGCSDSSVQQDFVKIKSPDIKFTNIPPGGCIPFTVSPQAQIEFISNITSYKWDFGDGTPPETTQNPTHTYTKLGIYDISLTIMTADGCTASYTLHNATGAGTKPKADFDAAPRIVCGDQKVNFTNLSQPPGVETIWSFGDGTYSTESNPSYNYPDTGYFQVVLYVYNYGCVDSLVSVKNFIHKAPPISRFLPIPDCNTPYRYTFQDASIFDAASEGKRTWKWVFPDGSISTSPTPPPYNFPGPGNYPVSLTTSNGTCVNTFSQTVTIVDKMPDFTPYNQSGNCKPVYASFRATAKNQAEIVNYKWEIEGHVMQFSNTNEVGYGFYNSGDINVKLTTTDKFGCSYTITKPIHIGGPKAAFAGMNAQGCLGITTTFNDSSRSDGIHNIVSWRWNFGDRTPSVDTTNNGPVKHTYIKKGVFSPRLVVTDNVGCIDSVVLTDYVKISSLTAAFNFTQQVCIGSPINFSNQSSSNYDTSIWTFGDGQPPVTAASGQYTYKDTGRYTVKLVVADAFGCRDSIQANNAVLVSKPVAAFAVNDSISFCPPFDVQFTNQSKFIGSVAWDFGNLGTSTELNPKLTLTKPGKYYVRLRIVSPDNNCSDSAFKTLQVLSSQDAQLNYNPFQACVPGAVNLSAFGKLASAKFFWDFGDGNILDTSINQVTHTYVDLGSFIPKIILTESSGCVLAIAGTQPIKINGAIAKFGIDKQSFCDSGYVSLTDSTKFNDPITQYNWSFGDNTTSNLQNPRHEYTAPGLYTVSLNVQTENGCTSSITLKTPVKVVQSPLIGMIGDSIICVNDRMREAGVFEREDTSAVRWVWSFPNGNLAFVQNPANQQYTKAGNFIVTAIATNSSGCTDSVFKNILVNPLPTVTLPPVITVQQGYPVTIPAIYTSNVINYSWYPDSSLSCNNCPQPVATPKFNTKYTVSFVDSNGCKNTGEVQIIVACKNANVFVPNTFSPNGDGHNDIFYVRGRGLERVKSLRIFNRWGQIVFEKREFAVNDPSAGWNGMQNGRKPQPDVYVYQLEVYCENGQVIYLDGNVALIQ